MHLVTFFRQKCPCELAFKVDESLLCWQASYPMIWSKIIYIHLQMIHFCPLSSMIFPLKMPPWSIHRGFPLPPSNHPRCPRCLTFVKDDEAQLAETQKGTLKQPLATVGQGEPWIIGWLIMVVITIVNNSYRKYRYYTLYYVIIPPQELIVVNGVYTTGYFQWLWGWQSFRRTKNAMLEGCNQFEILDDRLPEIQKCPQILRVWSQLFWLIRKYNSRVFATPVERWRQFRQRPGNHPWAAATLQPSWRSYGCEIWLFFSKKVSWHLAVGQNPGDHQNSCNFLVFIPSKYGMNHRFWSLKISMKSATIHPSLKNGQLTLEDPNTLAFVSWSCWSPPRPADLLPSHCQSSPGPMNHRFFVHQNRVFLVVLLKKWLNVIEALQQMCITLGSWAAYLAWATCFLWSCNDDNNTMIRIK